MPRTPWNDDDDPLEDDGEGGTDENGEPYLPFDPADIEEFYDWEQDFPELDFMDDISDMDDSDFY